jgi:WD40 repeat protein
MNEPLINSNLDESERERGERIRTLFDQAVQGKREHRDRLIDASDEDIEIRDEVRSLLEFIDATMVDQEDDGDRQQEETDSPRSLVGCRLGDFELLRLVGTGGTSMVFEARQRRPDRIVAVKVLRAAFSGPQARRRFEREVEITGGFEHPSIARVFASGSLDVAGRKAPWLAMEFVEGALPITLFARKKNLDSRATVTLFREAIAGIRYAHSKGVIHRDLKPANILVGSNGKVRVIDFGIARLDSTTQQFDTLATMPGQVLGTVPFMAPEQIDGDRESTDVRTDGYALGVVAYLLLTGRMPYELADCGMVEAAHRIRETMPGSLRVYDSAIDRDLDGIVQKSLEKSLTARYQSVDAMDADYKAWLEDRPVTARPLGRMVRTARWSRRNPMTASMIGAAAVSLLAALVVLTVMLRRETGLLRIAQRSAADAQLGSAISAHAAGDMASVRLRLAEIPVSERGWEYGWLENQIDRSEMTITGFRDDVSSIDLVDAPGSDERWMIVSAYDGVHAIDLTSGLKKWFNAWNSNDSGWRHCVVPSRNLVLSVDLGGSIKSIDLQTGKTILIGSTPEPIGEVIAIPQEEVAVLAGEEGNVYVIDLQTLEIKTTAATGSRAVRTLAVLPDARIILGTEEGIVFETNSDLDILTPILDRDSVVLRFGISESGRLVAVCGGNGITEILNSETWEIVHRLRGNKGGVWQAMFDDVNGVVHTVGTDDSIRTFDLLSGEQTNMIGSSQGYIWSGVLSEDRRFVWSGGHDGTVKKWRVRDTVILLPNAAIPGAVVFSPSGDRIAISDDTGRVQVLDAYTQRWIKSIEFAENAESLYWPTSNRLYVGLDGNGLMQIDPSNGDRRAIFKSGVVSSFDAHPDGGFLAGFSDGHLIHISLEGEIKARAHPGRPDPNGLMVSPMKISTSAQRRQVAIVGGERSASVQLFSLDDWSQIEGIPQTILNYEFDVDFSPSGKEVALVGRERPKNILVLDLERLEYTTRISGHQGNSRHVSYIDQGTRIVSAGQDGAVFISRPGDGRTLAKLLQVTGAIRGLAISPDEHLIAVTSEEGLNLILGGLWDD